MVGERRRDMGGFVLKMGGGGGGGSFNIGGYYVISILKHIAVST